MGCNDTKPIIISSKLDNDMEVKLLGVLERNVEIFALSIEDIKGISLSICMHKILMKEDHAPSIEHLMSILNTHFIPHVLLRFW